MQSHFPLFNILLTAYQARMLEYQILADLVWCKYLSKAFAYSFSLKT